MADTAVEVSTITGVADLNASVKADIQARNAEVIANVKNSLAKKALDYRGELLMKALESYRQAEIELRKIKPDIVTPAQNGQPETRSYSTGEYQKLTKAQELVNRWLKAFENAILRADYQALEKLNKNPKATDDEPSGTATE